MNEELKPLSKKHKAFADRWLKCFNGTRAYMDTYPKASYETAKANASDLLSKTNIAAYISDRLSALQMSADEALSLLAEQARGDIGDFMAINSMGFELDLEAARESGKTRLIKEIEQKIVTITGGKEEKEIYTTRIKLHDQQGALDKILRVHGRYKDTGDIGNALMQIVKRLGVDTDKL